MPPEPDLSTGACLESCSDSGAGLRGCELLVELAIEGMVPVDAQRLQDQVPFAGREMGSRCRRTNCNGVMACPKLGGRHSELPGSRVCKPLQCRAASRPGHQLYRVTTIACMIRTGDRLTCASEVRGVLRQKTRPAFTARSATPSECASCRQPRRGTGKRPELHRQSRLRRHPRIWMP